MSWNAKRRRRVLVAAACVVAVVGAAAGAARLREVQLDRRAAQAGAAGRAALESGDASAALDGIGAYLQRFADRGATADDYVLYARARRRVELPNGRHLVGAVSALRRAMEIDPACDAARADLLDLYVENGFAAEALALVDERLARSPDDLAMLRTKRDLLESTRRYADALAVARRIDAAAPDDVGGLVRTLELMTESRTGAAEVDAWIDQTVRKHVGDPRFELLRAAAATARHDDATANACLDRVLASSAGTEDPAFAKLLVGRLDAAGRFDDSLRALESAGDVADADIRKERLRRLWYARTPERIPELVARWDRPGSAADPETLALDALALGAAGRTADADAVLARLRGLKDRAGRAWTLVVDRASRGGDAGVGGPDAAVLADGAAASPSSAMLRDALGDAYAGLGEMELALETWTAAASRAPAWAEPLVKVARALLVAGRPRLAQPLARAAFARAPHDVDAILTFVRAAAQDDVVDARRVDAALAALDVVAKEAPIRADDALEVRVDLLSRVDRAAAEAQMRAALAADPSPRASTLLALASTAARTDVPLAARLLERCESVHGATPDVAAARAGLRAGTTRADAVLAEFDQARARAAAGTSPLAWDVARARCVERLGRPEAAAGWIGLADANPTALNVQLGALACGAVRTDRDAAARIIERVRGLTGDDAVAWRTARARWLLAAASPTAAQTAEAASILNDVVRRVPRDLQARLLLADALERLGNLAGAEEQCRLAADLAPSEGPIVLEAARLAQRQGRADVARRDVERVVAAGAVDASERERAARLLAALGDPRRGVELLASAAASPDARSETLALLVELFSQLGEDERALALCGRLLAGSDVGAVEAAADAYAAAGRSEDAAKALARLDAVPARPGDRDLVRARFAARFGSADAARASFARAVDEAPARPDAWRARLDFAVTSGDDGLLRAILDDPRAGCCEPVRFLGGVRDLALAAVRDVRLRAVLLGAVDAAGDRPALVEAIRIACAQGRGAEGSPPASAAVRDLAAANVRVLPLQLLAAETCAEAGDLAAARDIARRSADEFPSSAAALRQAAEMSARAGRFGDALEFALRWSERAGRRDVAAEALVGEALARCGRPAESVARLGPFVAAARARVEADVRVETVFAASLVRVGKVDEAARRVAACRPSWRSAVAFGADPDLLGDAASAAAWLSRVAAPLVGDDLSARLHLARAWGAAWDRFDAPELLAGARAALAPLTNAKDPPAEALCLEAWFAQRAGDLAAARRGYEAALRRDPALETARNNLAVVLADLGLATQAVDVATRLTDAAPSIAEYQDTLAYALRKAGAPGRARACIEKAVRLDPTNAEWRVSLAETLVESGDRDAARAVVARVEEMTDEGVAPSKALRDRLEKLRRDAR